MWERLRSLLSRKWVGAVLGSREIPVMPSFKTQGLPVPTFRGWCRAQRSPLVLL